MKNYIKIMSIFLCLLFYWQSGFAQGTSCSSPIVFQSGDTLKSNNSTTDREVWFKFTAAQQRYRVQITSKAGFAPMVSAGVYAGACGNQYFIERADSAGGIIEFEVNGLITDSLYYIKVSRPDSGTTAKFDALLTAFTVTPCACINTNPCGLICNGSFEDFGTCPALTGQIYRACPWDNPNTASADFYHAQECNSANNSISVPNNLFGNEAAHTGSGYAAIVVYIDNTGTSQPWHEYLTQQFQSPMIAGHTYTVSFWVSLADVSKYAIHALGAYISTSAVTQNNTNYLNFTPQILNTSGYLTNKTGWVQISGQYYSANGGEQYITIGNFQPYANIQTQSLTGTGPWAYYYIDDVAVEDNVTISVTPSKPTICSGQGVTLSVNGNVPGPFSWLPTTGLSSSTGSSVVASPTVTTTYTVTAACGQTATANVTVLPLPQLTVSNNAAICPGSNTQLSASGATTYTWSPSTGLSNANIANPVASPTVTTTYTVTGTDGNGCQATGTVTVTVNSLPVCNITGSITSACSNTGQFSTTSLSGASYSWSVSPTATITSGQGTNTVNIDFTGNVAQSYTVSVVVTNTATSCQSTCDYFVSACCTPVDGMTLFNDTSSNYNSIMTGQVGINGLFVVDNNCTFYGLDVRLGYNAKILILPGASLTITDNTGTPSRLYACDYMWDGIYIDGTTASLTVNKGSSIEDAQNAIVSNNGGVYTVGGTSTNGNVKLNKNYKNIVVNSYTGVHTGTVTATEITCNNSVTPVTYTTTNLRPPHSNERTYVGVEVNSVTNATPLAIGSASNANLQNDFDNMDYGIIATNSNVTVKNNEFMNITSPGFSKKTTSCPKGTAICARGNSSIWTNGRTVTVGGANTNEPNTIRDGGIGIDAASNLNLFATYNTFSNLTQVGITAARNYLKTVTCENNTFRDIPLGIKGFDLRGSTISMSSNSMNMKNKNNAQGIVVAETFQTPLTRYTISSNTIDTVRNGISGTALVGSKMDNNTIRLKHTTNANVYGRGIYVNGGSSPNVRKNSIYGQNRNDWWMEGVRIDLSSADTVTCNNTDDLGAGQFFSGSQPFTYFAKNSMTDHLWGLLLNGGGFIGQQGAQGSPNDNTWNGSFTLQQTRANYSFGNLSPFYVQSTSAYNPSINDCVPAPPAADTITFIPTNGSSSLNCASATVGADANAATDLGIDIAEGSITYPSYSDENVWSSQWALYNYIKGNASLLDDPTIQSFYDEADAGNIGYLYRVMDIMGNMDGQDSTDLDSALTYNSSIDPLNAIETNWQDVNNILITNAQNAVEIPTDGQLNELLIIAQKCPLSDGPAVYIARAILATYDTSYVEYEDVCEQPDTSTGSGSRLMAQQPLKQGNIKLYPNPNNGDMVLAYELAEGESGDLVIYDLSGKAVKRVILEQEQAQMPVKTELPNGVYLYRVTVNGEVRKTDKLVIVR